MNTFGRIFRIHIFGESHGEGLGVVIDGCRAGVPLTVADFADDLQRRKSGARGTTPRRESDLPEIVSGVYNDRTTGAPLTILFRNENTRSQDYSQFATTPRPGHADFTGALKFDNFNDPRGGGHFSGRLTLGLVAAGVVAKKLIAPVTVAATLVEAGGSADVAAKVDEALAEGDSVGGLIHCTATNVPAGLGEPFFDSVESLLAHILFAIPAVKGVEFGSGFAATRMKGSENNDAFVSSDGTTLSNNAGGINGGISNGNALTLNVAVKPTPSISREQTTFNFATGKPETLKIHGRHDACIALRAPAVIEAAVAVALADLIRIK
jgi:chorismate synthase